MKILFLLVPLLLLLVQGAAGTAADCRRQQGFCSFYFCPHGTTLIGRCASPLVCCKR
ncbi:AMP1 protein, partial [Climacteris rufus]|nr:AMP1 protein [Climacteris rufus]